MPAANSIAAAGTVAASSFMLTKSRNPGSISVMEKSDATVLAMAARLPQTFLG